MRICAECGAANAEEARFCGSCGAPVRASCPRCGTALPGPVRFCPSCGLALDEERGAEKERKLVTVLFADLTGSTGLGERFDPEQLREVMEAFFEAMRREIEAEGGTVEKFIGDAVMAVFGVPTAHEDDPSRAVRAALRMRKALARLNERLIADHHVTLAMRVGINTGEVVALASPPFGEGMVVGDTVNVASRLERAARPGQIVVSERTARATRRFRFREIGFARLRGKEQVVPAVEVIEAEPSAERGPAGVQPEMVGRDRELQLLDSLYRRVADERRPHLVTVYGEAGVGKSRLIDELTSWSARLDLPARLVRGRCLPYGEGVTYWPVVEIMKQEADVLDSDTPEVALAKIREMAGRLLGPDVAIDPARAGAALALTVGIPDPESPLAEVEPRQIRLELVEAWASFFSAQGAAAATIAAVEDTHWADPALLDLLEELVDRVEGPVLFVCSARPEFTVKRPGWGGGRVNFSSLLLEPLPLPEAERLLDAVLSMEGSVEEVPPEIRSRILDRAGGNPFFLEEIVRHLVEEKKLVPDGSRPDLGDVEIPDTVQGVLAARMDLLRPLEKRALQAASVVGKVFWAGPVARLVGAQPDTLQRVLDQLRARGLIVGRLSSTMAGDHEYSFKHVLTRDVAYESLPRRARAGAHAVVADWIEATAGERHAEFAELLAHHYGAAYRGMQGDTRAPPASTETARLQAFEFSVLASESARRKLALDNAIRLAQAAGDLAAEDLERAIALEALGRAYFLDSQGDLAWDGLKRAVDLRVASGKEDSPALVRLCAAALEVATRGRGTMRARVTAEEARPYLELGLSHIGDGDSEAMARLLVVQSFWPFSFREEQSNAEDVERATEAGERAAAMALRLGRPELASAALDGVGSSYISRGLYGRMDAVVERRLQLAEVIEDPWELGDIYAVAAWVDFHIGRYREAVGLATLGFERSRQGALGMALHCLDWRAVARCRLGEWGEFFADADLVQELLGERRKDPPGFVADHLATRAFLHEVQGDHASADQLLVVLRRLERAEGPASSRAGWHALFLARRGAFDEARAVLEPTVLTAQRYGWGPILEARCDLVAAQESWNEAPGTIKEAREHAEHAGLLALPAYADRLEGRAALAAGDGEAAARALSRARESFAKLDARWEAAVTALDLAEALMASSRAKEAGAALAAATPILEELRSVREASRAEELRSRLA